MSKGHYSAAFYSTLAMRGFFPEEELTEFMGPLSRLSGHPNRNELPGVEASTGPPGHGLPSAVGAAMAARMDASGWRSFVLAGDGELQEGSNWEAIMSATRVALDKVILIVDRDGIQQGGPTESIIGVDPLADKFYAFGWSVREVDGHNCTALVEALQAASYQAARPSCLIARTTLFETRVRS